MPHALSGRNAAFLLGVWLSKKGSTVTFLYVLASISSSSIELIESVTVGDRVGGVADRYRRLFSIPPSLSEGLQGWGVKILCQGAGVLQIHCL